MGTVSELDAARAERARRSERLAAMAELAAMHPALRWVAGTTYWLAHRRAEEGGAACGADGDLMLAPPGVPLCVSCYPVRQQEMSG